MQFLFRIAIRCRALLPKKRTQAFGLFSTEDCPRIEHICVINLNRQPCRWTKMEQELRLQLDWRGGELWGLSERYAAVDARNFEKGKIIEADVDLTYTLEDQLFVEPQPLALPSKLELNSPIQMSEPEIAIAQSHIGIWRQVAAGNHEYVLILEDDIWFRPGFSKHLNQAWAETGFEKDKAGNFDILYLSYEEVKHGAPKTFLSENVFRPVRGLWHLSGYVISRQGAKKLLRLLPCRGPVDLWINHQFDKLDVRAISRSIISQRRDISSTNSYSILPSLTKIGALTSEGASLFHIRPKERPVFAFGPRESGLSSLAMALSMLGYRCCSDLRELPSAEHERLLNVAEDRIFDAYVNIGSLEGETRVLLKQYPKAKFIITARKTNSTDKDSLGILGDLKGADIAILRLESSNKWQVICEHLRCAPPACCFPEIDDMKQRHILCNISEEIVGSNSSVPKRDISPWVIEPRQSWQGIHSVPIEKKSSATLSTVKFGDYFRFLDTRLWYPRDDTFTDNLAMFRPLNIEFSPEIGAALSVRRESLGVREYSAASLTSRDQYLFGKFEVVLKASKKPGVVTGFFLHRNSPRQEIDIEIAGNRTDCLIVNVFYNPGSEGANFDYGYRGAASHIDLGFDASESYHLFTIEWGPSEICWLVDGRLVHKRANWAPSPIPHLPMSLHINVWPSRSKELAGRLTNRKLPATSFVKSISLEAARHQKK